jgi:hypothetical protein
LGALLLTGIGSRDSLWIDVMGMFQLFEHHFSDLDSSVTNLMNELGIQFNLVDSIGTQNFRQSAK